MKTISIVIPVYNEAKTLARCVERVVKVPLPMQREILLIDDASVDDSAQVIDEICRAYPDVEFKKITHTVNQGKGAALRSGFAAVTGDIVLVQDADLEYDPKDYTRLLKPILDGRADVVYGSRFTGSEEKRVLFYWHSVGNKFLTTVSNMCTNLNLTDMECCYKMMRREVIERIEIKSNRFGVEPELTAKIAKAGWRVYEVGISYSGRTYEEGKKITWKDGFSALWTILKYRFIN